MTEDQVGALVTGLTLLAVALSFGYLVHRVATDRLPRNVWFGVRIPSTLRSDAGWRAGHRAALPALRAAVVVAALCAVLALALVPASAPAALTMGLVGVAAIAALAIVGAWRAHRAATAA